MGVSLTHVVDGGEETVVCELLPDVVQLDAEVGNRALLAQELGAKFIPLFPEGYELAGEGKGSGLVFFGIFFLVDWL
jgi:hypothetical protein